MSQETNPFSEIQAVLQRILGVVGHSDDEALAISQGLLTRIMQFALTYLVAEKPKYKEVLASLKDVNDPTEFMKVIFAHMTLDKISHSIQVATTDVMTTYFQGIAGDLSSNQKEAIVGIVAKFEERVK